MAAEDESNFHQRRVALVEKHDKNGDGRLDASEREQMRLALKQTRLSKKGSGFPIPADFLAKYDRDKDGEMQGEEWKIAWEAETKILTDTYDADKDGTLNKAEKQAMMAAVGAGKITGIPAFFAQRMLQDGSKSAPEHLATQKEMLKFDANGDGLIAGIYFDAPQLV